MSERAKTHSLPAELDKAIRYAVTLAWADLLKPTEPRSVRLEYLCEPGTELDHLSVWAVRAGGYQDLVCDCWTWASAAHPSGASFGDRQHSETLAQTLDFVLKHQSKFTRSVDAGRHGLVQIYPPDANDRAEASSWWGEVRMMESDAGAAQGAQPPRVHAQKQVAPN
jgi:hypothetical protein